MVQVGGEAQGRISPEPEADVGAEVLPPQQEEFVMAATTDEDSDSTDADTADGRAYTSTNPVTEQVSEDSGMAIVPWRGTFEAYIAGWFARVGHPNPLHSSPQQQWPRLRHFCYDLHGPTCTHWAHAMFPARRHSSTAGQVFGGHPQRQNPQLFRRHEVTAMGAV